MPVGKAEGLCSARNPWSWDCSASRKAQGAAARAGAPLQMPVSFMPLEIKWNTGEYWNTWNVVCSYWFALVPDLLVKSVVLLLDFLLVFGVGARDADNRRRFFLWIQHCGQAVPSILLSRGS